MMADEFGRVIRCASMRAGIEILLDLPDMPDAISCLALPSGVTCEKSKEAMRTLP
jgi:hypothetical protein